MMQVEGNNSLWLSGQAHLVEDDRELAWAERTVVPNPAFRWVLGRYVEADRANNNKQLWKLNDLPDAIGSIKNSPLNMLHAPRRVLGHYADAELLYPTGPGVEQAKYGEYRCPNHKNEGANTAVACFQCGETMVDTAAETQTPFVEALGVVYKYYFPEETKIIENAHAEGKLFYSMECTAETVTCVEGCGREFAYEGPRSKSYCEHINDRTSPRSMNKPWFLGGALLVPPVTPGWKNANVFDIAEIVKTNAEECEKAYENISTEMPHGSVNEWESLMAQVVGLATQMEKGGRLPPEGQKMALSAGRRPAFPETQI